MKELSGYVFSPLREGNVSLYRGSGNGLAPILLVAAEETSPGCIERLEHEFALKGELDADWAARPVALTHHNGRMTLVLEDPGGAPQVPRPGDVLHSGLGGGALSACRAAHSRSRPRSRPSVRPAASPGRSAVTT